MTITREYLDALDLEADEASVLNADAAADLIAALRRVLDLRDTIDAELTAVRRLTGDTGPTVVDRIDAALAGTQTEPRCSCEPSREWSGAEFMDGPPGPDQGCPIHGERAGTQTDDGADQGRPGAASNAADAPLPAPSSPDRIEVARRAARAHTVFNASHDAVAEAIVVALDAYDRAHTTVGVTPAQVTYIEADLRERIAADPESIEYVTRQLWHAADDFGTPEVWAKDAAEMVARIVRSEVPR